MKLKKIGIDVENGDDTLDGSVAKRVISAVQRFSKERSDVEIYLHGNGKKILDCFGNVLPNRVNIVQASQFYSQGEKIDRRVKGSVLNNLTESIRSGNIEGFFSIGDTSKVALEASKIRNRGCGIPALVAIFPNVLGEEYVCSDVGFTTQHSDKENYLDAVRGFANGIYKQSLMSTLYMKSRGVERPRWGILSNGVEEHKGSDIDKALEVLVEKGIQERSLGNLIDYRGKVEPGDCLDGKVDVVLVDGYEGNLYLKTAEACFSRLIGLAKDEISKLNFYDKTKLFLASGSLRKIKNNLLAKVDPDKHSGAVILGYDGAIVKGHGASNSKAIYYGICRLADCTSENCGKEVANTIREYMLDQ